MFINPTNMSRKLSSWLLVSFCMLSSISLFAQTSTPKKVEINGKSYFVYPYGRKVNMSNAFRNAVLFFSDEELTSIVKRETPKISDDEMQETLDNFHNYINEMKRNNPKRYQDLKEMTEVLKSKSDYFVNSNAEFDNDIVPSLDKLPDGQYIQYYENYFVFDSKGKMTFNDEKVAGYFTLKNNNLNGSALWLNIHGDSLKFGSFVNGQKNGTWIVRNLQANSVVLNKKQAQKLIESPLSFSEELVTYENGIKQGFYQYKKNNVILEKGYFKDAKPSGEWWTYSTKSKWENGERKDTFFLKNHFTYADLSKQKVTKKPMVRVYLLDDDLPTQDFSFPSSNLPRFDFTSFYKVNLAEEDEEGLELPEEKNGNFDYSSGEDEFMDYEEDYYELDGYNEYSRAYTFDGKEYSHAQIIDSVGYKNLFTDVYEEYYDNGNLKFRYVFKDGDLIAEDTVFWSNKKPANVIVWKEREQEFDEFHYDMKGKLYGHATYDHIGQFKEWIIDPTKKQEFVDIAGEKALKFVESFDEIGDYDYFELDYLDSLEYPLNNKITFYKEWYPNKVVNNVNTYDPSDKTIQSYVMSIAGDTIYKRLISYSSDFENYSFVSENIYGIFNRKRTGNASYHNYYKDPSKVTIEDTFPQARLVEYRRNYQETFEDEYLVNGMPFNGKCVVSFGQKKNEYKISDKLLTVKINTNYEFQKAWKKDLLAYWKTGKSKYAEMNKFMEVSYELSDFVYDMLPFISDLTFSSNDEYDYMPEEFMMNMKVTGSFQNGKPNGVWRLFNGKDLMVECTYLNGELQGDFKSWDIAYPMSKESKEMYMEEDPLVQYQSFPKKKTYFLTQKATYNKGIAQGKMTTYDWQQNIISESTYLNGVLHGPSFERNPLIYSKSNYEMGELDGIVNTYLTVPGKDSILLYDLNFQNGLLQGESKSYHANGKLSKKGFFLNGQPIDDYEGYDTLGFKYHYVKFKYSFPIEEKIYELNELSVRYQFDWKDSIYFRPTDLTESTSIDDLLYDLGLLGDYYDQPYYGRQSLVPKGRIKYHMTKYFPNDTIARDGDIKKNRKIGHWYFNSYGGERLYEVDYFDTILKVNDSIKFKSKGILFDYDAKGKLLSKSYIIERFEKYDCSHTDHYEIRQYYTIWEAHDSLKRMNGYVKNYYDNGTLQNEGMMKNGLPTGVWKFYDPNGKLNQVGEYVMGKRNGRWLHGDLSKTKYLGDICMNPNLPDLEERMETQEKMLDIYIRYFKLGKVLNSEYYDLNLNKYEEDGPPQQVESEE